MTSLTDIFNQDLFDNCGVEPDIDYDISVDNIFQYLIDNRQVRNFDYSIPIDAAVPEVLRRRNSQSPATLNGYRFYPNAYKDSSNISDMFCSKLISTLPTFKTSSAKYI